MHEKRKKNVSRETTMSTAAMTTNKRKYVHNAFEVISHYNITPSSHIACTISSLLWTSNGKYCVFFSRFLDFRKNRLAFFSVVFRLVLFSVKILSTTLQMKRRRKKMDIRRTTPEEMWIFVFIFILVDFFSRFCSSCGLCFSYLFRNKYFFFLSACCCCCFFFVFGCVLNRHTHVRSCGLFICIYAKSNCITTLLRFNFQHYC